MFLEVAIVTAQFSYCFFDSTITLSPSPSTITKTIQCSLSSTPSNVFSSYPLGSFVVNGLPCSTATAAPTVSTTPSIFGLVATLVAYKSPIQVDGKSNALQAPGPNEQCQYVLQFSYNAIPTKGQLNTQLTVNFALNNGGGMPRIASVPVTLNLNCAPQFQSITAFQVGQAPVLANAVTKTLLGSPPNNILVVNTPSNAAAAATAATITGTLPAPNTQSSLQPFMVNYVAEFGMAGILNSGKVNNPITKVFVNCATASLSDGLGSLAGTTVVGSLQATDPEGSVLKYFIWSEAQVIATAAGASSGEKWTITPDGIIMVSAIAHPVSSFTGTSGQSSVSHQAPDINGVPFTAQLAPATNFVARDVLISAVDASGGLSTLEARFYISCGQLLQQ